VLSASLTTIPPFFELMLPILIVQTEVGAVDIPVKLLVQEEIGSGPTVILSSRSMTHYTPYPKSSPKQHLYNHQPKPTSDNPASLENNVTDSKLMSDTNSDTESNASQLIPKPDGEAGQPGQGGYNFEEALK